MRGLGGNAIEEIINEIHRLKEIDLIKDKEERNIIHCLFQDLSDKLLDNQKGESNAKLD